MKEPLFKKEFDPTLFPKVVFPNWFTKEDAEMMQGEDISDEDWAGIVSKAGSDLADGVSEQFSMWLSDYFREKKSNRTTADQRKGKGK